MAVDSSHSDLTDPIVQRSLGRPATRALAGRRRRAHSPVHADLTGQLLFFHLLRQGISFGSHKLGLGKRSARGFLAQDRDIRLRRVFPKDGVLVRQEGETRGHPHPKGSEARCVA